MQIYIWGTGVIASDYLGKKEIKDNELLGFVQTSKSMNYFHGKPVLEPKELVLCQYDYIIVCVNLYASEIYNTCKEFKIPEEKLIIIDNYKWFDDTPINYMPSPYGYTKRINEKQDDEFIRQRFPQLYTYMKERKKEVSRYSLIMRNGYDLVDHHSLLYSDEFSSKDYQIDYCRYRTFELVANEILDKDIDGEVAEVGVFKGVFAKLINGKFKERKCFLFDTFESFDESEFKYEISKGRCLERFKSTFLDTSVEYVLNKMLYPDQCIIRKGIFPYTTKGLENIKYAFVSIDVDLEKSILEGLKYFYPRLNCGGVIFLHDYNNRFLEGVKVAVKIYEEEIGRDLVKLPISDEGGTLIIFKY